MKLTLAEAGYLKDSVNVISDLVTDVRINFSKQGMEIVAMDPANVAMIIFKLLSSSFIEYELEEDKVVGISLDNLKQVLRRAQSSDSLVLELERDNQLKLSLIGGNTRVFHLSLLSLEEDEQKVPNLSFPVKIKASSSFLDSAIEDVGIVAESVAFSLDPEKLVISSEGNITKAKVELGKDRVEISSDVSSNVLSKYSYEYLKKMVKGSKLASDVVIQFNKDYPLKLDYVVKDRLSLSFILAPRVQND